MSVYILWLIYTKHIRYYNLTCQRYCIYIQICPFVSVQRLRPVLANLRELSLKQLAACLSALAPPLKPPDLMPETDRKMLQDAVAALFQGASKWRILDII